MKHPQKLNAPWSLHFDRDGTEDIAIICDSNMEDLATSRFFWLPEDDDDIPPTLAGFLLMVLAPELLNTLHFVLEQTVDMDLKYGIALSEGEEKARARALDIFARLDGGIL